VNGYAKTYSGTGINRARSYESVSLL